jgi:ferredoxin
MKSVPPRQSGCATERQRLLYERCIGCAECVRVCPIRRNSRYDSFDIINNYKYKIALPAPSLYGQFQNLDS